MGGGGNDTYYVDHAADTIVELAGNGTNDTVIATAHHTLSAEVENLTFTGGSNLNGTGNGLANTLLGNNGRNLLNGGNGNDTITGGLGNDTLIGGSGDDTFVFKTLPTATNIDTISDFSAGDSIAFDTAVFSALSGDTFSADNFVVGTAAADSDDRLIYNVNTGALFYDADGSGGGAAVQVATLSNKYSLNWTDFEFQ